ncbi:cell division protein SepF [Mitsuokella sp.]|uniref:cell division protein SepF n=1 Tax=unclassified Mitsuokella TaxID=2637239 RepID=UPI003D7E932F
MNVIDKICGKFGLSDPDEEAKLAEAEAEEEAAKRERSQKRPYGEKEEEELGNNRERQEKEADNVVNLRSGTSVRENVVAAQMKVIIIEPKTFDDAQQVANNLRERKPVVINFEHTDAESAKRIIDFISGTTYALNGEIKKVGHNVFLCAPSNVNVTYTEEERKVSTEMPWLKK